MKRSLLKPLLVIMLIAGSIGGCQGKQSSSSEETEAIPVEVAEVMSGSLDGKKTLSGTAKADKEYHLTPSTVEEIAKLHVEKGDKVSKGDVLAELDRTNLELALKQEKVALKNAQNGQESAKANVERAQANYEQAREGVTAAENGVAQARSQLKQAKANLEEAKISRKNGIRNAEFNLTNAKNQKETAERELKRSEELYHAGIISLQELEKARDSVKKAEVAYDEAETALKQAQGKESLGSMEAAVEQAELSVEDAEQSVKDAKLRAEAAQIDIDEAKTGMKDAEGRIEQAELAVEQAEKNLNDAVIKAPDSGEILNVTSEVGELASQQEPLIEMAKLDIIKMEVQVTAEQLQLFEKGDDVPVSFVAFDEPVTGTIAYISSATNDNGLYTVEATIPNDDGHIRPGMYGKLIVEEEYVSESILVPSDAVIEKSGEDVVYVIDGENGETAYEVPVTVVRSESDVTAVEGDLAPGYQVVTKGQYMLNDGDPVTIMNEHQENDETDGENEATNDEEEESENEASNDEDEDRESDDK